MRWMTRRAPVHYVVDDAASTGTPVHYAVDDAASTGTLRVQPHHLGGELHSGGAPRAGPAAPPSPRHSV